MTARQIQTSCTADGGVSHHDSSADTPAHGPIVVGSQRTQILSDPAESAAAFRRARSLVLPDLFDAALLASLLDSCRRSDFVDECVRGLGTREIERPQRVGGAISLMLSRAPFLRWVEAATGCGPLDRAEGRVVQTRANGSDGLDWHDDLDNGNRLLGITISLLDAPVEGGWFELRKKGTEEPLARHLHRQPGTAMLFAVGPALEHRLLPIGSGGPRRVYSGWLFRAAPAGAA
jgi:hypothetical protein